MHSPLTLLWLLAVSVAAAPVQRFVCNCSYPEFPGVTQLSLPFQKKTVPSGVAKPKLEAAARTAAQKRLASVKAAMRHKMKQGESAEGAHQDRLPEPEKVIFEAGFFRIESPVKNFSGR